MFNKWTKIIAIASTLLFLSGCATLYQPRGLTGGYSDFQLDSNTYRVEFKGNGFTSREIVEIYLLYRCAEITANSDNEYFIMTGGDTEVRKSTYTTPGTYTSTTTATATAYGNTAYGTAYTSGTYNPGQTYNITKYGATATIKVFKGQKPSDYPTAFDAKELLHFLGPKIRRAGKR